MSVEYQLWSALYLNSIELTAKPWWDKNDFSWVSELEDKSELIAEELRTMLRTEELFKGVFAWLCMYVCMYLCLYVSMFVCMIAEGMDGWMGGFKGCVSMCTYWFVYTCLLCSFSYVYCDFPTLYVVLMCDMLLQISVCFSSIHCRLRQSL